LSANSACSCSRVVTLFLLQRTPSGMVSFL
jgi:hypothetical protein